MARFVVFPVYKEIAMIVDTSFGPTYDMQLIYANGKRLDTTYYIRPDFSIDDDELNRKIVIEAESPEDLDVDAIKALYF